MKPIIIVRHAHPADSHIPIAAHWVDAELSDLGRRQAESVAARLKSELAGQPCRIWSSDLRRAAETAAATGRALAVPVQTTPDLREYNGGLPAEVIEEELRKCVPATQATADLLANRAGETWPDFYHRVARCMERLTGLGAAPAQPPHGDAPAATESTEETLIVVAHYGTIGIIVHWWLGLGLTPAGDTPFSFETALASITVLSTKPNGKRCLERLNDTAHLWAAGLIGKTQLPT